jgi:hypothetical protein
MEQWKSVIMIKQVGTMQKTWCLFLNGLNNGWVTVTQSHHSNARSEVEVFAVV